MSEAARAALGVAGGLSIAPFDAAPVAAALGPSENVGLTASLKRLSNWLKGHKQGVTYSREEVIAALGELHNYELLRRPADRYETAHPLIHTYARERLPVAADALRRLGEYYAALAENESAQGLPGYQRLYPERAQSWPCCPGWRPPNCGTRLTG